MRTVKKMLHVNIGIFSRVIPGALELMMVTMKFILPNVAEAMSISNPAPPKVTPSWPLNSTVLSGAYTVQPVSIAPPGVKNPTAASRPPNRYIQ